MHGSTKYQVKYLFDHTISRIGESKHAAKAAARENIAAGTGNNSRSATWHEIGQRIGVFSHATADTYKNVWRYALEFAKENFQIRDIEKITGDVIAAYLQSKIEENVKYATFQKYAAALEKLNLSLNKYSANLSKGRSYDFSAAIKDIRITAQKNLEHFSGSRSYVNPEKIIALLKNDYKLAANLQLKAGLRIAEVSYIQQKQIQIENKIIIKGKGGKIRTIDVPKELYATLKNRINNDPHKSFFLNANKYRYRLEKAVTANREIYKGKSTHGLRWNYSQEKILLESNKHSYTKAMEVTSHQMGHNRIYVTEHYQG